MNKSPPVTRRTLIAAAVALPLTGLTARASVASAELLVTQAVNEITRVVNSGQSEAQLFRAFEQIFERYADVATIARYSLGVAARSASAEELRAYQDAYAGYVARKYGKRFREFIGGSITVKGSRQSGKFVVVDATANLRGELPFAMEFHVSDNSGRDKFFNVIIEGVNMLTSERTEIGALLDQQGGSISRLTQALNAAS